MKLIDLWITRVSGIFVDSVITDQNNESEIESDFICIQSEDGKIGTWGPINQLQSFFLLNCVRPRIHKFSIFATKHIWNELFRSERHGRSGHYITALSAFDLALWDLIGQVRNVPVFELLGGPTRRKIPAYASMLGFDPDAEYAPKLAQKIQAEGYHGQKWALRDGPAEGEEGLRRNLRRITRLREAVGEEHQLMVDVFGRWDLTYAREFCRRAEHVKLTWIEEPLPPELAHSYNRLKTATTLPIAVGEHCYTRFEAATLLDSNAIDYLQPDAGWCGGITELGRIVALASSIGIPIVPHGAGLIPSLHIAASECSTDIPLVEYHLTIEPRRQWFFNSLVKPEGGVITVPDVSGLGLKIDYEKVTIQRDLRTVEWN